MELLVSQGCHQGPEEQGKETRKQEKRWLYFDLLWSLSRRGCQLQGRQGHLGWESWIRVGGQFSSARSLYPGQRGCGWGAEMSASPRGIPTREAPLGRRPGSQPTQELQLWTAEVGTGKCSLQRSWICSWPPRPSCALSSRSYSPAHVYLPGGKASFVAEAVMLNDAGASRPCLSCCLNFFSEKLLEMQRSPRSTSITA